MTACLALPEPTACFRLRAMGATEACGRLPATLTLPQHDDVDESISVTYLKAHCETYLTEMHVPSFVMRYAVPDHASRGRGGDFYCCLLAHPPVKSETKNQTPLYVSRAPAYSVHVRNTWRVSDKHTSSNAPNWYLDMVLGPFTWDTQAWACGQRWLKGTRGHASKRHRARDMAAAHRVRLYRTDSV